MESYGNYASFMFQNVLIGLLTALLTGWLSIKVATRVGLIDTPGRAPHKIHNIPTPVGGGIGFALAAFMMFLVFGFQSTQETRAVLLPAMIIFIFGLWDDVRQLSPLLKLLGQVLAGVLLIVMGISVQIFQGGDLLGHGILPHLLNWGVTLLWVVGICNATNFVDSMDGLALGVSSVAFAFFALVALDSGQIAISRQSALLFGICIGLYYFNSPPARLFLGDSGAQTVGFILAVTAILYNPRGLAQVSSWYVPIMVLGVPILDTCLIVYSRVRRKKLFYAAGRDHLYDRLLVFGMDSNRAVLTMQMASMILGCLAFICLSLQAWIGNLVFFVVVLVGSIIMMFLDKSSIWK